MAADPYVVLGLTSTASDAQLRAAYRRLVKLHHPDHNHGTAAAAVKFEEVQEAYVRVMRERASATAVHPAAVPGPTADADIEARVAAIEKELAGRGPIRRAAAKRAAAERQPRRATREELGYIDSDDSLTAIVNDALERTGRRWRGTGSS